MTDFKNFRNINKTENFDDIILSRQGFSNYYDQPTYLSFRLKFESPDHYNKADNNTNYDLIPQPLFNKYKPLNGQQPTMYSTLSYLESINEFGRVKLLEQFIDQFNNLQENFPWYFQKVEGLEDILKIDPTKGLRVLEDRRITITCLEALDLRMSLLLNLYRKIAWDDMYQRWILPDIMRFFQLKIYIAEFRTFHKPTTKFNIKNGVLSNNSTTYLEIMDNILPVWLITCTGCQIDLGEITYDHISGLTVGEVPPVGSVKFKIKVKSISEAQIYPMFNKLVINDRALNGMDRSSEDVDVTTEDYNVQYKQDGNIKYAQNYPFGSSDQTWHQTGKSFNQYEVIPDPDSNNKYFKAFNEDATQNPKRDNWISKFADNTLDYAKSSAKSFVVQQLDKLKMYPIPQLGGLSFNEAISALQSADILTMYSLIKRSINVAADGFTEPSSKLSNEIADSTFQQYLNEVVSLSEATNDDLNLLTQTAEVLLNNADIYSEFNDIVNKKFSGIELNTIDSLFEGTLMSGNSLKDYIEEVTKGDLSSATIDSNDPKKQWIIDTIQFVSEKSNNKISNGEILGEGIPTSAATTNKIIKT
jgi:hypothetical protein